MNDTLDHKHRADLLDTDQIRLLVYAALMAAFIAVGAFIAIPIGPVPIVLQNLFVLLAGLLLGPRWGSVSVGIYLLAGICGLPVFAGGTGGLGRVLGPTGGYLISYLPAVAVVGIVSSLGKQRVVTDVIALIAGSCIVYAVGVPWLAAVTGMPPAKAVAVGMVPFLIGDALKVAAAIPISRAIRPVMHR